MQRNGFVDESDLVRSTDAETQVYVVDDDVDFRKSLCLLLDTVGYNVRGYGSARSFLANFVQDGCLIADVHMPQMDGITLLMELQRRSNPPASVVITGKGDVSLAVKAMKAGAVDFFEKPFADGALLKSVERAP